MLRKIREKLAGKTASMGSYEPISSAITNESKFGDKSKNKKTIEYLSEISANLGNKAAQNVEFAIADYNDAGFREGMTGSLSIHSDSKIASKKSFQKAIKNLSNPETRDLMNDMELSYNMGNYNALLAIRLSAKDFKRAVRTIHAYKDDPSAAVSVAAYLENLSAYQTFNKSTKEKVFKRLEDSYIVESITKAPKHEKRSKLVDKYMETIFEKK